MIEFSLSKRTIRLLFAGSILLLLLTLPYGFVTAERSVSSSAPQDVLEENGTQGGNRGQITVVGSDGWGTSGGRAQAELVAFRSAGSILYYNDTYDGYLDVDPVPGTTRTVVYVAHETLPSDSCDGYRCTRVLIERANVSTGKTMVLYSTKTPGIAGTRWHDIDHLSGSRYVVADIARDRIFILNTTTKTEEWSWSLKNRYNVSTTGGKWPTDWTHLNDVEVLPPSAEPNARFMVSVRNHDSVVFVNKNGLVENWTLGAEDRYGILYEQHNPDYIPASRGGPAILVADSQNNRVVEYQRRNGTWTRSWQWSDARLQWPRDADRLPNGNTLITDSNGDRILEVNEAGQVVRSVGIGLPYEAERLGTGDESTGGESAARLQLETRNEGSCRKEGSDCGAASSDGGPIQLLFRTVVSILPTKVVNGLIFILPTWFDPLQSVAIVTSSVMGMLWLLVEHRWRTFALRLPFVWRPD